MNRFTLSLLTLFLLVPVSVSAGDIEAFVNKGDSLYGIYDYMQSVEYYEDALLLDSSLAEPNWKKSRSLNLYGELQPKENQLELFERSAEAARKTITIDSLQPEGHFQLARALGKIALFKGIFKSVSLAKKVKKEAEITIELRPDHDGAIHILGRWHREVSKKPKFLRIPLGLGAANKKKGLPLLARAIQLKPDVVNHRLEYAISLLDSDYDKKARKQFNICIGLPPAGPVDLKYQKQAKEYLAKLE